MSRASNSVDLERPLGSKRTTTGRASRQKQGIILDWVVDDDAGPTDVVQIERILTHRSSRIHRKQLEDPKQWRIGWP